MDLLAGFPFVFFCLEPSNNLRMQQVRGKPQVVTELSAKELLAEPERLFALLAERDAADLRSWIEDEERGDCRIDIFSLRARRQRDVFSLASRTREKGRPHVDILWLDMAHPIQDALLQSHLIRADSLHELTSALAHEMNNPLAVALGFANLLVEEELSPKMREIVEPMIASLQRAAKLAKSLHQLSWQRPSGRVALSLNDTLNSLLDLKQEKLASQGIEVAVHLPQRGLVVKGDGSELQQVFLHLLSNAEYVLEPTGGRIEVTAAVEDKAVRVSVSDNGPGIPEELHQKIFTPFFSTKPEGQGTGLGLAISKRIVESHGGALTFESKQGQGTTFHVVLPLAEPPEGEAGPPVEKEKPQLPPLRILVADDDRTLAESLHYILQHYGHDVTVAAGGVEVIMKLKESRYDAVLADWHMPGGGGQRVYEYLKKHDPKAAPRLIVMTGTLDTAVLEALLPSVRILRKPFSSQELLTNLMEVAG